MNRKIIGIFICLMLMTAILTTAHNVKNSSIKYEYNEIDTISFDEGDVPVWEVGDKWTYRVDKIVIDFEQTDFSIFVDGNIDTLELEVNKVTEEFYELNYEAVISGFYELYTDFGDGPINITGELKSTTIEGTITYNKTDLAIKQVHIIISGRLTIKIVEQPYYDLSFMPNIPIPATIVLDLGLGNPYPLIEFPLNTSKCWGLPATNFSLSGTIESSWLKLANTINKFLRIPGVIPFLAAILGTDPDMLKEISDILNDILPIIDIKYVLNEYVDIDNVFEIPAVPTILCCFGKDYVKVPAREEPFEAYNISLLGSSLGNIYYSPEVGNKIKITGDFEEVLPFVSNINAELISYRFNPK